MPPNAPPLELLTLLYGDASAEIASVSPRLLHWAEAFNAWLDSIERLHRRAARRQAHQAWRLLLAYHPCPPWLLDRSRLESWLSHLVAGGVRANTLRCYRGRISGFFRFCSRHPHLLPGDPLFRNSTKFFNPLRGARQPNVKNYQNAYVLTLSEARRLLRAVDRHATLVGQRDYAILLTLLLTGLHESELLCLRWQDLSLTPAGVRIQALPPAYGDKPLPLSAWRAILAYLRASGRYATLQPGDYIFVPLVDPLHQPLGRSPADWCAARPLSTEQMYVSLKAYAAWAGLDAARITFASLRHTAALLCLESGAAASDLQEFLGRSYLKETRRYIVHLARLLGERRIRRRRFTGFRQVNSPLVRKKPYGQPGNLNALRHGLYAPLPLPPGGLHQPALAVPTLEPEIVYLRLLLRRALSLAGHTRNPAEALRLLDLFGRAAVRIGHLLVKQKELEPLGLDPATESEFAQIARQLHLDEE
jgi:integrase